MYSKSNHVLQIKNKIIRPDKIRKNSILSTNIYMFNYKHRSILKR